jgi:hypothetical protein
MTEDHGPSPGISFSYSSSSSSSNPAERGAGVLEYRKETRKNCNLQYFITALLHCPTFEDDDEYENEASHQ